MSQLEGGGRGSAMLTRPRLEHLADRVLEARVTVLAAAAGYGKSTLLDRWADAIPAARVSLTPADREVTVLATRLSDALRLRVPGIGSEATPVAGLGPQPGGAEGDRAVALASMLARTLDRNLTRPVALMIDDLHEIDRSDGAQLVEALVRHAPEALAVVLSGRSDPPVRLARVRARRLVWDLAPADLAFTADETLELATTLLGKGGRGVADAVHQVTGGWPVATRLALEAIADAGVDRAEEVLRGAPRPGGALFEYLTEEVFSSLPAGERQTLAVLAELGVFDVDLCHAVGMADVDAGLLSGLVDRSVFVEEIDSRFRVRPPLAVSLSQQLGAEIDRTALHRAAAGRMLERREGGEALRHAMEANDPALVATVLERIGEPMLVEGSTGKVLTACRTIPEPLRSQSIRRIEGEAQQMTGDWDGALATFSELAGDGSCDPGVAWRMGLIHHLRGDLDLALDAYHRGDPETGAPADRAMLCGWWAAAKWLRGDVQACRRLAEEAWEIASASSDDRAMANASTVLAMLAAVDGDRRANESLYLRALRHAERAGDALQMVRIHVNRGSRLLEEGAYLESIAETNLGLDLAASGGFASLQALGLNNRGQARFRMGLFEEATTDFTEAMALWDRLDSPQAAYAMVAIGDIQRVLGDNTLARASYEAAVAAARPVGDLQALVPALTGLARVLALDDPEEARKLADEAIACGPVLGKAAALVAAAHARLEAGEPEDALRYASEALELARDRRDRAGIAEALEALAASGDRAADRLEEALSIWMRLGDPLGAARVRLRLAQLGPADEMVVEQVRARLRSLGARRLAGQADDLLAEIRNTTRHDVAIGVLGGLRLTVDGDPVPAAAWQSRKARDVLKVLVVRRGRPIHREQLVDLLWPDDEPSKTANRLSVALTVVRNVLDPNRSHPADHYLEADRDSVRLRVDRVDIDLETFHAMRDRGAAAMRAGDAEVASAAFETAEALYVGDLLEEDPYAEWAVSAREQARNAYMSTARWLATHSRDTGDLEAAGRYLLRVLQRDPFDEQAHLDLVTVLVLDERHGEARRLYDRYCARMDELGVEAAPFPSITFSRP